MGILAFVMRKDQQKEWMRSIFLSNLIWKEKGKKKKKRTTNINIALANVSRKRKGKRSF